MTTKTRPTFKTSAQDIKLDEVDADLAISVRELKVNPEVVAQYGECLDQLPPVKVIHMRRKNKPYILADGHHIFAAYQAAKKETIPAVVAEGRYDDALAVAAHANAKRGITLKPTEYRRACERLLSLGWTPAEISDALGRSLRWISRYECAATIRKHLGLEYREHLPQIQEESIDAIMPAGEHLWGPIVKLGAARSWPIGDYREIARRAAKDGELVRRIQDIAKDDAACADWQKSPLSPRELDEVKRIEREAQLAEARAKAEAERKKADEAERKRREADEKAERARQAQAEAEARAKAEADARAKAEAEAKAKSSANGAQAPADPPKQAGKSGDVEADSAPAEQTQRAAPAPAEESKGVPVTEFRSPVKRANRVESAQDDETVSEGDVNSALATLIEQVAPTLLKASPEMAANVLVKNAPNAVAQLVGYIDEFLNWATDMLNEVEDLTGTSREPETGKKPQPAAKK